jgi:hypothetical protein
MRFLPGTLQVLELLLKLFLNRGGARALNAYDANYNAISRFL